VVGGASVSDVAEVGDSVLDVPSPVDEVGDVAEVGDGVLVVSPDGVGVSVGDGVISQMGLA
jgi:hypothetical protein